MELSTLRSTRPQSAQHPISLAHTRTSPSPPLLAVLLVCFSAATASVGGSDASSHSVREIPRTGLSESDASSHSVREIPRTGLSESELRLHHDDKLSLALSMSLSGGVGSSRHVGHDPIGGSGGPPGDEEPHSEKYLALSSLSRGSGGGGPQELSSLSRGSGGGGAQDSSASSGVVPGELVDAMVEKGDGREGAADREVVDAMVEEGGRADTIAGDEAGISSSATGVDPDPSELAADREDTTGAGPPPPGAGGSCSESHADVFASSNRSRGEGGEDPGAQDSSGVVLSGEGIGVDSNTDVSGGRAIVPEERDLANSSEGREGDAVEGAGSSQKFLAALSSSLTNDGPADHVPNMRKTPPPPSDPSDDAPASSKREPPPPSDPSDDVASSKREPPPPSDPSDDAPASSKREPPPPSDPSDDAASSKRSRGGSLHTEETTEGGATSREGAEEPHDLGVPSATWRASSSALLEGGRTPGGQREIPPPSEQPAPPTEWDHAAGGEAGEGDPAAGEGETGTGEWDEEQEAGEWEEDQWSPEEWEIWQHEQDQLAAIAASHGEQVQVLQRDFHTEKDAFRGTMLLSEGTKEVLWVMWVMCRRL